MRIGESFSKWNSSTTNMSLERSPIILSSDEANHQKEETVYIYDTELTKLAILKSGIHEEVPHDNYHSIYSCRDSLTIEIPNSTGNFQVNGGVIGIPAQSGSHKVSANKTNTLRVSYKLDDIDPKMDHHCISRPWSLSKKTASETLKVGQNKWKRKNGRKFIATSIYPKFEKALERDKDFYVPGNDGIFPILTSRDVFLSIANQNDGQDYHCHQNSLEILIVFGELDFMFYDLVSDSIKNVTFKEGGLIVIPALIYHAIRITDDNEVLFIGVRETDAGTDKHTFNPTAIRDDISVVNCKKTTA